LHEIKDGVISKDVISTVKETSKKSAAEKEKAAGRTLMITTFKNDPTRMDLLDNIQDFIDKGEITEADIPDVIKDNFRFKKAKP
jgi:predicted nucleotidyltransferase